MSKVTMWRSRWRCVIKPAYSISFLLSINIFVWQNVLYFLDAPRILTSTTTLFEHFLYDLWRFWELQPVWLPGECTMDLQKAFLEDRPVWYRLEDPRQLRGGGKTAHSSPRSSLANEVAQRLLRKAEFGQQRSFSGLFSPHWKKPTLYRDFILSLFK